MKVSPRLHIAERPSEDLSESMPVPERTVVPSFDAAPVPTLTGSTIAKGTSVLYEKAGAFEIRLATSAKDLRRAQKLRY